MHEQPNIDPKFIISNSLRVARAPAVLLFILFHTLALVVWISPPFPLHSSLFVPLIRPYVCYFGFWNQWLMFSHPKTFNIYLTANVSFDDGRVVVWNFPRMEKLDVVSRALQARYRQWAHDYVNEGEYTLVRSDACRFIARQVSDAKASSRPVRVELIRHWTWIQPPFDATKTVPEGQFDYSFFSYDVTPEDLK